MPELTTAQLILSNGEDAQHWERVGLLYGHGASTPGVLAATAAYDDGADWLDDVLGQLDVNRHYLAELCSPTGCLRSGTGRPRAPTSRGSTAGGSGSSRRGADRRAGVRGARLNSATPRPVLTTIVKRMAAAVGAP